MLEVIIAVAAAILLGNILAHRMRVPPAVLLIFLGLMLALIPAHQLNEVREVGLPPHVILEIFLPVMLFWETRNTSWREARARLRGILLTGTLLVVFTAFAIAWVLHAFCMPSSASPTGRLHSSSAPRSRRPMRWPWRR
ncbi:MAG: cation:proton antiporter [Peptidiphaga sp.]|uniref:cation:proton antiporter domain-containing protein n=1 Tax=Actinobaculum sp. oral taxon 183 TaxID=712888 RepID=UPI000397895A|nr:cation:proton antiporter [Actinobaculum sp. oral taxon 183]ERH19106.1 hypothetical protein HMPREF0043_00967 [Actinobaculum sp. oral taxon 183 str. F0552]